MKHIYKPVFPCIPGGPGGPITDPPPPVPVGNGFYYKLLFLHNLLILI